MLKVCLSLTKKPIRAWSRGADTPRSACPQVSPAKAFQVAPEVEIAHVGNDSDLGSRLGRSSNGSDASSYYQDWSWFGGQEEFGPMMVPWPWGPERANRDRLDQAQMLASQQNYRKVLDEQRTRKQMLADKWRQDERELDANTYRSLDTKHHSWGIDPVNFRLEKTVADELVATMEQRQLLTKLQQDDEREAYAELASRNLDNFIKDITSRKDQKRKQEKQLVEAWQEVAETRQRNHQESRASKLQSERKEMARISKGALPHRPMRRMVLPPDARAR